MDRTKVILNGFGINRAVYLNGTLLSYNGEWEMDWGHTATRGALLLASALSAAVTPHTDSAYQQAILDKVVAKLPPGNFKAVINFDKLYDPVGCYMTVVEQDLPDSGIPTGTGGPLL